MTVPGRYTTSAPEKGTSHFRVHPKHPTVLLDSPGSCPSAGRARRAGQTNNESQFSGVPKEWGPMVATPRAPTPPGLPTVPVPVIPPPAFLEDFHHHAALPVQSLSELRVPCDNVGGMLSFPNFRAGDAEAGRKLLPRTSARAFGRRFALRGRPCSAELPSPRPYLQGTASSV